MTDEKQSLPQIANRWLGIVGLFVAPTTLVTGLCYFFGSVSTSERLKYFGVDSHSLGFTTADYVVMNVKVVFFAVMRLLLVCVVLVWAAVTVHRLADSGRGTRLIRIAAWVSIGIAVVGLGIAVSWLLFEYPPLGEPTVIATLIGAGTGLLVAGYWMLLTSRKGQEGQARRRFPTAERVSLGIAVAVMVMALFWLTDIYAAGFGQRAGEYDANRLWDSDIGVLLVTTEPLETPSELSTLLKVTEVRSDDPRAGVTYRYECLRKLEVRDNRWVLVPAKWKRDKGFAVTVTPEGASRVIARPVDAKATGKNPNVFPYWQCPEVVRTFSESDLEPMLVDPDEAQKDLGVEKLVSAALPAAAPRDTVAQRSEECQRLVGLNVTAAFDDSGFVAGRSRRMTQAGPPPQLSVDESVVTFGDPATAGNFMFKTEQTWLHCQNAVVNLQNGNVQRKLGGVGVRDDIYVLDNSIPGDRLSYCSHGMAAKSNVVVDVRLCGSDKPADAFNLVSAIRNKIPS